MTKHKFHREVDGYIRDDGKYRIRPVDDVLCGHTRRVYQIIDRDGKVIGGWSRLKDAKTSCEIAT